MAYRRNGSDGIDRRDFLNGVALTIGASMIGGAPLAGAQSGRPYPPALTGMRGSHPGSFEVAHGLAAGQTWNAAPLDEQYDLVIVGAGISGLSAAYFYRRDVDPSARILILDNHDDFGGHAKRNEFTHKGQTLIGFGGTMLIEAPRGYPQVARQLITELGIDFDSDESFSHETMLESRGLGRGLFFDRETFGKDALVVGDAAADGALDVTGLTEQGRADVQRLFQNKETYLANLSVAARREVLDTLSYRQYLQQYAGMGDEALAVMQKRSHGVWAIGADQLPAWLAWYDGYPGFGALDLGEQGVDGVAEATHYPNIRFPDGNATVARLLVSRLVPNSVEAAGLDRLMTARFDYAALDRPTNDVCIRLSSTVIRLEHIDADLNNAVRVTYVKDGDARTITAPKVIWAGYHNILPYVCPDVPESQSQALSQSVRAPLVYTNVLLDNWRSLDALGIWRVQCPGSFFQHMRMTHPVSFGDYRYAQSPDQPVILHMQHIPLAPGQPAAEQFRAGRRQLLETPFAVFEEAVKDQLTRVLGAGGFDAERHIGGITVNRWSHGYAYSTHPETGEVAWYPERWGDVQPWREASAAVGNIRIAGTDAGSNAMTEEAILQAHNAVSGLR